MLFDLPEIPSATKTRVRSLAAKNRLPQSILLTGGSEKLREKCALELAGTAVCENKISGAPCGKCPACKKLKAGSHPDVIPVRPEKDKKNVSVAAVRELVLDRLYVAPNEAPDKVYIFYTAGELSPLIQNTLLKTMEEPPPFVMFILLSEQRDTLLSTVVSRVTEFPLGDVLTAERKNKEEEIAGIANGVARALARGDEYALMASTAPLTKNRALMKKTAERLILIVRDAAAFGESEPLGGNEEAAMRLHAAFSLTQLYALKETLEQLALYAASNANENLLQTLFSSRLWEIANRG
ncbi:MAG: hypothetical protein IK108_10580 [Clostridia bacterium]|nr:hypothetical protein [Clostridia bacterium]